MPVKNVIATWIVPDQIELVSGEETEECGDIQTGDKCELLIKVGISGSINLGNNGIKLRIDYGK